MNQLITDTITYLRQEGYLLKMPIIQGAPLPKPKPKPKPKEAPRIEPIAFVQKQNPSPMLFSAIQKHLPHIRLIQEIPRVREVAIVLSEEGELDFIKNIARAIQDHFCPVKILRKTSTANWQSFFLVLTQEKIEEISKEKQILLAKAEHYENNTIEKKTLWSQICQSLKSF